MAFKNVLTTFSQWHVSKVLLKVKNKNSTFVNASCVCEAEHATFVAAIIQATKMITIFPDRNFECFLIVNFNLKK